MRRSSEVKQMREIKRDKKQVWQRMRLVHPRDYPPTKPPEGMVSFWMNRKYTCIVVEQESGFGLVRRLMIQRTDGGYIRHWLDLQRVKNDVAGPSRMAVEVFPPEAEVVNDCHVYHLFVLPRGMERVLTIFQDQDRKD